ncbi:hypothetical protein B0T18DRAFT_390139 [Schizothecium vesticola]|uniref:Uncharacterized protein n=1 Tax=Schizothecium vesticola TaxID=314040 RepID=A0AA40K4P3_9PEZI|nr:hypothetical protein B0T18DRAFT_390139 [Schizothecium vesticola]
MAQVSVKGLLVAALFLSKHVTANTGNYSLVKACEDQSLTATHNVDIAPMATGCVSVIDGLKTLKIGELVVDFGDTTFNATTFNLTGIDSIDGRVAIVVDTYGCGLEPSCRVPDMDPVFRYVTSDALRKITGPVLFRGKSGISGPRNPLVLQFPLLDSGSETGLMSDGPGGIFRAEFGTSEVLLELRVKTSQPVGFGANVTSFYLSDSQLPHGPDKLNLLSNCRGSATIEIMNNTGLGMVLLPNLNGAEKVTVTSNTDLHTVELGIANASHMSVQKNAPNMNLTLLHLRSIGVNNTANGYSGFAGTFSDLSSISLPRLEKTLGIPSDLIFANNTILALQLPRLGSVNGSLIINTNKALFDIGLPRLQTVSSDLIIHDNPRLLNFTANVLKTASSISLIGPFTNVEFFSLERVSGNFEVIGDPSMDCSWFDAHLRDKIVKGSYTCVGNHTYTPRRPSTSTELPPDGMEAPGGPGGEDGGGPSTAAKAGIGAGAAVGALALIGLGVWGFLRWRRKKGDGARGFLPWGRKKVGPLGPTDKPELDGAGKLLAEKDGVGINKKDVPVGELPVAGVEDGESEDGLPVARNLNAEGEVVELP